MKENNSKELIGLKNKAKDMIDKINDDKFINNLINIMKYFLHRKQRN